MDGPPISRAEHLNSLEMRLIIIAFYWPLFGAISKPQDGNQIGPLSKGHIRTEFDVQIHYSHS